MADLKNAIAAIADYDAGVSRFMGNEAMYRRFLLKFIKDESYGKLVAAMDAGDAKGAFDAAHTLKGTSATLELNAIARTVDPVVESLRVGDLASAGRSMPELGLAYEEAIGVLKGLVRE